MRNFVVMLACVASACGPTATARDEVLTNNDAAGSAGPVELDALPAAFAGHWTISTPQNDKAPIGLRLSASGVEEDWSQFALNGAAYVRQFRISRITRTSSAPVTYTLALEPAQALSLMVGDGGICLVESIWVGDQPKQLACYRKAAANMTKEQGDAGRSERT